MSNSLTSSSLTLSSLIGVSIADSPCVLSLDQFVRIGALLLQQRPQDTRSVCFLGGALSALMSGRRGQAADVVSLGGDLGADPFLVIAGQQGAVALLAVEVGGGFRARLFSDPDLVDRAALVLSQFSDHAYSLDAMCDPEAQRAFLAAVAGALAADPALRGADLGGMAPEERAWIDLARSLADVGDRAGLLTQPLVRRLLQEHGVAQALAGAFDIDLRQLGVLTATTSGAPPVVAPLPPLLAGVARSQRSGSATAADTAALGAALGAWVAGRALSATPLLRDGRTWGLLLAVSERPLTTVARAALQGLSVLLVQVLRDAPLPAGTGALLNAPPAPSSGMPQGLAARLSAPRPLPGAAIGNGPRPPAPPPATQPPAPSPATPPPATQLPAATRAAPSLAQRAMSLGQSLSGPSIEVAALLEHISDGVLIVDGQGRLAAVTKTAMQMLGLGKEARGKSLVESGAWCLAPLFTEAITGELDGPREVELPSGRRAAVHVISLDSGLWAFVIHTDETQPALPADVAADHLPAVAEGERNESFLSNFSNIIRVPLRELRELITQVPAVGNLNEQQSRLIGQVVRLNSELTMLVNDLLALGQIRLQTSEARVPLRLDLLVDAAVGTQYAEFGRRGQHVTTEIAPGLPRVAGSEEGLGRAVAALIDNAIKYSPAGAQIKVSVVHRDNNLVISVQDNGPGLEPEELAQVFDPFFRAPSTERLGISGRGLGLTITKAVIEQHGGRVWATGTPGHGCAFSFSIPCE